MILILSVLAARADDLEVCRTQGDEAISACGRLIASGNLNTHDLVVAHTLRGAARDEKGELDGAFADYDQAIKLDPKAPRPYFGRSLVRWEKGDVGGAIADYNQSVALDPTLAPPSDYAVELAGVAYSRKDYVNALSIYRPLADQGNAKAQTSLGTMYENGLGVLQDYAEAARLYRLAADQGYAPAQAALGIKYSRGEGVPQNDAEAVRLYRLAAQQDHAAAEMMLGLAYRDGLGGVTQSYAEAVKWFTLAAEQGEAFAQSQLGALYATGQGVPQDHVRAHMWLNLSAAQGNETAMKNRDRTTRRMTPEQIAEAQKLAREWKPRKPTSK